MSPNRDVDLHKQSSSFEGSTAAQGEGVSTWQNTWFHPLYDVTAYGLRHDELGLLNDGCWRTGSLQRAVYPRLFSFLSDEFWAHIKFLKVTIYVQNVSLCLSTNQPVIFTMLHPVFFCFFTFYMYFRKANIPKAGSYYCPYMMQCFKRFTNKDVKWAPQNGWKQLCSDFWGTWVLHFKTVFY